MALVVHFSPSSSGSGIGVVEYEGLENGNGACKRLTLHQLVDLAARFAEGNSGLTGTFSPGTSGLGGTFFGGTSWVARASVWLLEAVW